jgi:hypothetical protein
MRAQATPGQAVLTVHALAFGVLSATGKLFQGTSKGWGKDFTIDAQEAADKVAPLGGIFLRKSGFSKECRA